MKQSKHISDEDLRLVASEKETRTSQTQIESHISKCQHCQNRLLELAVNSTWRSDIVANCSDLQQEMDLEDSASFDSIHADWACINTPSGDEFDLQTVDQMLKEVLQSPTHPEMLGRLGRYDVEGVIGSGGMGVVLRGFDRELHRPVAIKMILPRLSKNGTAKQRFGREARAAATVLHPNVIGIHDIGETEGVPWLVMPLIAGPTLRTLVEHNGALPERDIVRIGVQIASGLAAAHSQGLVHRDVKPENILVDNQINRVVITDFGLARRETDEAMTQTGFLAGSVNYMSPEQSRGGDLDSRSDLFSLGGLLFFLATGEAPFRSSSPMGVIHSISNDSHIKVQSLNSEISTTLANVVDRLLEKKPESRFQSATELESFLNDYLVHLHQPLQADVPKLPELRHPEPNRETSNLQNSLRASLLKAIVLLVGLTVVITSAFLAGQFWNPSRPGVASTEKTTPSDPKNESSLFSSEQLLSSDALDQLWAQTRERHGLEQPGKFHDELQSLQDQFRRIEKHHNTPSIVESQFESQRIRLQVKAENHQRVIEQWSGQSKSHRDVLEDETTIDGK